MECNAIKPARFEHREVEMILAHALDRPRDRLLLRAQRSVEIKGIFPLYMAANEARIRNRHAGVFDIRKQLLGRLERIALHRTVGNPGKLQEHHHLDYILNETATTEKWPE